MPRSRIKGWLALASELLALALCLLLALLCLRSLITAEIQFGRSSRVISLYQEPGWFWTAFWVQLLLSAVGIAGCCFALRKQWARLHGQEASTSAAPPS